MPYGQPAQLANLVPFRGASDPRRSNGRKPSHRTKIRAFLAEQHPEPHTDGRILTEEDRIVLKAVELAALGDRHSRAFLFDRAYGKPIETHRVSDTVRHEINCLTGMSESELIALQERNDRGEIAFRQSGDQWYWHEITEAEFSDSEPPVPVSNHSETE